MSGVTMEQTIAQLVLERPARSRVFETLGIDYCCGGKKTLKQVCEKKKLDPCELIELLSQDAEESIQEGQITEASLTSLISNIIESHHDYLRRELPRLDAMLLKVTRVHGGGEPRLQQMLSVFQPFSEELMSHMLEEEDILFPAIKQLEANPDTASSGETSETALIAKLEAEHDAAGDALAELRTLSDDYTPPVWACNTYRALLDGLHDLERNMHQHVHKENNILFPKTATLEASRSTGVVA